MLYYILEYNPNFGILGNYTKKTDNKCSFAFSVLNILHYLHLNYGFSHNDLHEENMLVLVKDNKFIDFKLFDFDVSSTNKIKNNSLFKNLEYFKEDRITDEDGIVTTKKIYPDTLFRFIYDILRFFIALDIQDCDNENNENNDTLDTLFQINTYVMKTFEQIKNRLIEKNLSVITAETDKTEKMLLVDRIYFHSLFNTVKYLRKYDIYSDLKDLIKLYPNNFAPKKQQGGKLIKSNNYKSYKKYKQRYLDLKQTHK